MIIQGLVHIDASVWGALGRLLYALAKWKKKTVRA
jgi:hypothetical protein